MTLYTAKRLGTALLWLAIFAYWMLSTAEGMPADYGQQARAAADRLQAHQRAKDAAERFALAAQRVCPNSEYLEVEPGVVQCVRRKAGK